MSVVYIELDGYWVDAALRILEERGIRAHNTIYSDGDDDLNAKVVNYRRVYSGHLLHSIRNADDMIEHEVRRVADAWRIELRKLIVEARV